MKKRILIFSILFYVVTCAFCLEKLNVGSYQIGDVSIGCYDDQSVRIRDLERVEIIFDCIDVDTAVKASLKIKDVIESKNITSVEQMLIFFNKERIEYEYEQYRESSNYYVDAQTFLEEYLVVKYGIKSGKKIFFSSGDTEYRNWNKESKQYDYEINTSSDSYAYTVEYKSWNKNIQGYEYKIYRYPDHTVEYKNWDKEKQNHDYCLHTYSDCTIEYKNFNKEKNYYDYRLGSYSNYKEECTNWNREYFCYDYCLLTYSDHTEEYKGCNGPASYDYRVDKYSDYTIEYKNWKGISAEACVATYADHTEEYKNWNYNYGLFEDEIYTYSDRTVERKRVDGGYFNVDIKDKTGRIIAYDHVITPLQNGKRDIEVFSGGIVYQYFGVTESKDGRKFTFNFLKKIENGKVKKIKGGSLSREDFYMDAYRLL